MKRLIPFTSGKIASLVVIVLISSSCADKMRPEDIKSLMVKNNEAPFENHVLEFDAQFMVNAAEIGIEQIQLGQLAQNNSNMIDVMRLGKMMQLEHHRSLQTLNVIAQKKSIHVPVSMTDNAMDTYTVLRKKSGNKFDKIYCNKMIKEHEDAIALFESALTELTDDDIRNWASTTLPLLRANLDQAITCQKYCAKWTTKDKFKQIGFAQIVN